MPRQPKPYLKDGWYCTSVGGVAHQRLCRKDEGEATARIALARLILRRADGHRAAGVPARSATVAQVHDDFLDFKKTENREGTYQFYVEKLLPFYHRFGNRPISSLTYQDGVRFKAWLRHEKPWVKGKTPMKGVSPTTVNNTIRAAKALLTWACSELRRDQYGTTVNAWRELRYDREKPRERCITEDEFGHLLDHCNDGNVTGGARDFRELLTVMRYTSMRPGEVRALQWSYIKWGHHRIVIPHKDVKTARRREVVMIDRVEKVLKERKARLEGEHGRVWGYVFPAVGVDRQGRRSAVDFERRMNHRALSQRVYRLVDRCVAKGLIEKTVNGERIVPYSTRHTRITELFVEGNDYAVVMFDAGHVVPSTTERYKHLASSHVAESIRRKDRNSVKEGGGG